MRNFKALRVWQKGIQITLASYKITACFPPNGRFGLVSQINRAAVSIHSNIAEGSSRNSRKEYIHYIQISQGSCFELETPLLIAQELNYGSAEIVSGVLALLTEEEKMLTTFGKLLSGGQ
jgi:four helix bundle protein